MSISIASDDGFVEGAKLADLELNGFAITGADHERGAVLNGLAIMGAVHDRGAVPNEAGSVNDGAVPGNICEFEGMKLEKAIWSVLFSPSEHTVS